MNSSQCSQYQLRYWSQVALRENNVKVRNGNLLIIRREATRVIQEVLGIFLSITKSLWNWFFFFFFPCHFVCYICSITSFVSAGSRNEAHCEIMRSRKFSPFSGKLSTRESQNQFRTLGKRHVQFTNFHIICCIFSESVCVNLPLGSEKPSNWAEPIIKLNSLPCEKLLKL